MKFLKNLIKAIFGLGSQQDVKPLDNLVYVGSKHHGYTIPQGLLNKDSVCYCIGAGEDISFDTELKRIYDAKVFVFDPTPEGKNYFVHLKESMQKGIRESVEGDPDFTYKVTQPQMDEMVYVEKGVWNEDTVLKFYAPNSIDNYISHSVYLFKESGEYINAPVDRMNNFMRQFGHETIDLVKMEIEGAEYAVLETIVQDKLKVKVICVEFDEVFHSKGIRYMFRIKKSCNALKKAGFILVHSTPLLKRTFVHKDVYNVLKSRR